nr:Chain E, PEPTIDE (ALA-GLY-GLY-ALA-ALA-ALA-ALA-ALA) [synthetic construct]
AGGAAAAA